MPYEILLTETLGRNGCEIVYVKPPESNKLSRLNTSLNHGDNIINKFWNLLKDAILPRGYPDSVSSDYAVYQMWDTVQAFSSTISHTLTTHAVLVGVGVGNKEASALSAAITWIFKDGIGMISKILFAWSAGSKFDSDCKKWRLFADVLNDIAMLLELWLLPAFPDHSLKLLCISSSMKALVGVAGGATRAAVTQHQAISENMGDVSAKDGSQETCVNLAASILGIAFLSHFSESGFVYPLFFLLTILHIFANYKAVRSLKFSVLNPERFHLLVYHYLLSGFALGPDKISPLESVSIFSGFSEVKFSGCNIVLGSSLKECNLTSNQLRMLSSLYKDRRFIIVHGSKCVRIVLSKEFTTYDLFQSYFHGLYLALASSNVVSKVPTALAYCAKSDNSPYKRFLNLLERMPLRKSEERLNIEELIEIDQLGTLEFNNFWSKVKAAGWSLDHHQMHGLDCGWRASWGLSLTSGTPFHIKPHTL